MAILNNIHGDDRFLAYLIHTNARYTNQLPTDSSWPGRTETSKAGPTQHLGRPPATVSARPEAALGFLEKRTLNVKIQWRDAASSRRVPWNDGFERLLIAVAPARNNCN